MPFSGCQLRLRRLSREVDGAALGLTAELKLATLRVPANRDAVEAGEVGGTVQLVQRGWAFRYKRWPDGRRQILDFLLPGDLVGLESGLLGMTGHSVRALTELELCQLDPHRLDELLRGQPLLALALAKHQSLEARRMDARFAVIGRRTALQRLAWLMLDLCERQRAGHDGAARCAFPLRRQHIADATGLTGAHVNRTLNRLRRERLARVEGAELVIEDRRELAQLAGWEPIPQAQT